jgi:hypothetical protein
MESRGDFLVVKVADIIANVEHVKDGWSESKTPAEYKELFDKRREARKPIEDVVSPIRKELGKLQDSGLSQKLSDLQEVTIVGKK